MRKKRPAPALLLPHGVRALVPVFAPIGGAGRSTVSGLLAQVLAPTTRTLVVDSAPPSSSPWPGWLGIDAGERPHPGLPAVLSHGPVAGLASVVGRPVPLGGQGRGPGRGREDPLDVGPGGPGGPGYDVLTDCRPLTAPPVVVPEDPRWYVDVLESGSWFAGVLDLRAPVPAAHVQARNAGHASVLDLWWRRTDAVPVVVLPSSGDGLRATRRLLALLDRDGLSPARIVLAVVDVAGPDVPRHVRTGIAGLGGADQRGVAAVVPVPYDPAIRAYGLSRLDQVSHAVLAAVTDVARLVVAGVRPHRDAPAEGPGAEQTERRTSARTRAPGWVPVRHRVSATPYDPLVEPSEFDPSASDLFQSDLSGSEPSESESELSGSEPSESEPSASTPSARRDRLDSSDAADRAEEPWSRA
ncbi:hypothetical protein ABN028_07405 [Actinopolymorpha sp. B17G11]|uniref:hypothetical protein n=1 Tax=Actinopolymorpha sp. B17G11 TaxID=3160861 RepID=UPI0032E37E8F